jgi:hypothetical protein
MTRSLTLTAALLSMTAAAPALAQQGSTLPRLVCAAQPVTFHAQTSEGALSGWAANAVSQHGAAWNRWPLAADRSLQQINHSHYGLIWRAEGRPCASILQILRP